MNEQRVLEALETLNGMGDIIMERIATYITSNLDDFIECYRDNCPLCNHVGFEIDNSGSLKCDCCGNVWYPE